MAKRCRARCSRRTRVLLGAALLASVAPGPRVPGRPGEERQGPGAMSFPGSEWAAVAPEEEGLDAAKLLAAVEYVEASTGRDGARELVIARRGRLVWSGDRSDHRHGVWSCTKSFTSTVLGLLIADGKCTLDTRVRDSALELAAHYPEVTFRHLATMTSGYRAEGDEPQGSYRHGPSRTPFAPSPRPLFTPPGSQYAYWDSAMNVLGLALTRLAGEPLEELFRRRIARPIGMNDERWDWGDYATIDGRVVNGGSGNAGKHISISARELARLGHLFLNEGRWMGRQLLPAEWIREATRVQVPASLPWAQPESEIDARGTYGFNWWVNGVRADGRRLWPGAPERTFAALGYNNNRLIVIPEWRMVIVRLGEDAGDRTLTDDAQSEFIARVGRAFTDGTPAAGTAAAPAPSLPHSSAPRPPDGDGAVAITGELKQWHKVTLTIDGPFARERDEEPNPFTDYRLTIAFTHESGAPRYAVPGYFAADGNAAHSSAEAGTRWRAHLAPDRAGKWTYAISFRRGKDAAVSDAASEPVSGIDGKTGEFTIAATDKTGRDFRSRGRLEYSGRHHLRFAGTGEYFLKAGADSPETLLACTDFDGTAPGRSTVRRAGEARPEPALHRYEPHVQDWRDGDPTWKDGKGKGLIGALNYLAAQGLNAVSFLPYNAGGDGDNVWPFTGRGDRLHYDCSKLDQWGLVFDHATALGLFLHFKLQETEMDDQRTGHQAEPAVVPEALDGGRLGQERKLYCRELVARFGHALALNWNLGEENTQTTEEQRDMIRYLAATDPYRHPIVIHTFPDQQDQVYTALLGEPSQLAGTSLQNAWDQTHERVLKWRRESARAGRPWVVASDEQGPASDGVPVDPGYAGRDGFAGEGAAKYNLDGIRKLTLWGNLMAGGAGVEYYFGYQQPQNDLGCEDFRSRERSWSYCRIALEFFREHRIPFWEMAGADALLGDPAGGRRKFCLAREGEFYLVYLPDGGTSELDLSAAKRSFRVAWFNPRAGGPLAEGSVQSVAGGGRAAIGLPPAGGAAGEDWLAVIR